MKRDDRSVQSASMTNDGIEQMTELGRTLHDRYIGSLVAAGAKRLHNTFSRNKTAVPMKESLKYS